MPMQWGPVWRLLPVSVRPDPTETNKVSLSTQGGKQPWARHNAHCIYPCFIQRILPLLLENVLNPPIRGMAAQLTQAT